MSCKSAAMNIAVLFLQFGKFGVFLHLDMEISLNSFFPFSLEEIFVKCGGDVTEPQSWASLKVSGIFERFPHVCV